MKFIEIFEELFKGIKQIYGSYFPTKKVSKKGPGNTKEFDLEDNNPYEDWCDNEFFFKIKYSNYKENPSASIWDVYEMKVMTYDKIVLQELLIT